MKDTGIVRAVDGLGRLVIPKEIRRTYRIKENDSMEIYTNQEGEIILKKYSPIGELSTFAKEYAESLAQVSGHVAASTDKDSVVAGSGGLKSMRGMEISDALEERMNRRESVIASKGEDSYVPILKEMPGEAESVAVNPILSAGDVVGSVCLIGTKEGEKLGEVDQKLIQAAAVFLGKQMEV
ncbi:MAG: AbrB/MazE/SpoVT family DNA-binding domain-containing protein [Lachnospiraceae bacterium]|nr:AbrB/MazE/SpoVT family DNA-binding domain-containing protein [Lachnospiraceae bacterium]